MQNLFLRMASDVDLNAGLSFASDVSLNAGFSFDILRSLWKEPAFQTDFQLRLISFERFRSAKFQKNLHQWANPRSQKDQEKTRLSKWGRSAGKMKWKRNGEWEEHRREKKTEIEKQRGNWWCLNISKMNSHKTARVRYSQNFHDQIVCGNFPTIKLSKQWLYLIFSISYHPLNAKVPEFPWCLF